MPDQNENDPNEVLKMQAPDPEALQRAQQEIAELRAVLSRSASVSRHPSSYEMPRYYLNEPAFLEDNFYPAGCVLEWDDVPNREMVPQNEAARARMRELLEHLEYGARAVAHQRGRNFYGLVMDNNVLLDQYRQDVSKEVANPPPPVIQMPVRKDEVPAMPNTDAALAAARRNPKPSGKIGKVESPMPKTDRGAPMLPAVVGRGAA